MGLEHLDLDFFFRLTLILITFFICFLFRHEKHNME